VRRVTVVMLFVAIFVAELGWSGISPLLPSYEVRYGLTEVATGLIVSLASVGILIVSLPASGLSNRFGVRKLTLLSLGVLAAGNLVVGLSKSYPALLAGRTIYGVGLGTIWVTGTAWLHDAAGDSGARALALTTSVVGAAALLAPSFSGWLGERFTLGTPFIVLGGFCAVVLVVLLVLRSPTGSSKGSNPPLREMLRAARADALMVTSIVLTLAVALMWMSAELLVPLRLHELGYGAARIGFAFSAASVVFLTSSAVTSARAERWANVRIATIWMAAFAVSVLIAVIGVGAVPTISFLLAAGLTTGVLIALTYPLGATGATQGGFSVAVVGALINIVWAGSGLIGPIVGGAVAQAIGDRLWFVGLAAGAVAAAAWMWRRRDVRKSVQTEGTLGP
jgi:MFS transporter, ACDE family, multidrug resistance protein